MGLFPAKNTTGYFDTDPLDRNFLWKAVAYLLDIYFFRNVDKSITLPSESPVSEEKKCAYLATPLPALPPEYLLLSQWVPILAPTKLC